MKTIARIDRNQPEIVKAFRKLGWTVAHIYQLKNIADLIVAKNGFTALVEVKDGEKPPSQRRLTDGEREFAENWAGVYVVIESLSDVLRFDEEVRLGKTLTLGWKS